MPAKKIQQRKFPSILTVQQFRCLYTHPKALKYCNNVIYNGFSSDHPILISKSRPSLVDLRPKLPPAVLARCVMFFWLCYSLGKAMCHGNLGRKVWRFSWHNLSYLKFSLFLLRNRSLPSTLSSQWDWRNKKSPKIRQNLDLDLDLKSFSWMWIFLAMDWINWSNPAL